MAKMSESEVPSLLFFPLGSPPDVPISGDLRMYFDFSTSLLRTIDSSGVIRNVGGIQIWGPISNGNPASPCICNSLGAILLSRRA